MNIEKQVEIRCDALISYLQYIQTDCTGIDLSTTDISERIDFVKSKEQSITKDVNKHFSEIWNVIEPHIQSEKISKIYELVDKKLKKYFHVGNSYNQRVYDKPLGYDGDYLTIYHLFLLYTGIGTYEILINQYSRNIPMALGHKYRIDFLLNTFDSLKKKDSKVLSIGCGPGIELLKFSMQPHFDSIEFTMVDMDNAALDFIKDKVQKSCNNIKYIHITALSLIKNLRKKSLNINHQDLIYCCGLFDYLEDRAAKQIINGLYEYLNKNGKLIITNISKDVTERAYYEVLGKWKLILRDEKDLLSLIDDGINQDQIKFFRDEYYNTNIFIELTKK